MREQILFLTVLLGTDAALAATEPTTIAPAKECSVSPSSLAGVDDRVKELLRTVNEPGAAVLVVQDDCIILAKGYGYRDLAKQLPVTADTLFQLGSNTKAITALNAVMLADQGKLVLDAPVRSVLPEFSMPLASGPLAVTMIDILSHRTGLAPNNALWYGNSKITRQQIAEKIALLEPLSPPRTSFHYNNLMYAVAGLVVERASGQTWEAFTRSHVLDPLGMKAATVSTAAYRRTPDHATPYFLRNSAPLAINPRVLGAMAPAGGLSASLHELAPYVRMLLNHGSVDGVHIASPAAIAALMTSRGSRGEPPLEPGATPAEYGLGYNVDRYQGLRRIHHTGSIDGFHSRLVLFPDQKIGIFVASNTDASRLPEIISNEIADRLAGLPRRDWYSVYRKAYERRTAAEPIPSVAISKTNAATIVGSYRNAPYGLIRVTFKHGRLIARYNAAELELKSITEARYQLVPTDPDHYPPFVSGSPISVEFGADGRVRALSVAFEPGTAPIHFVRQPK